MFGLRKDSFEEGKYRTIHSFRGGVRKEVSLSNFDIIFDTPCWYRIIEDDLCLDVFLVLKQKPKICFFGQDALIEGRTDLPYFYRAKWHSYFDASFVTFNDPSLYEWQGIRCGWWQMEGALDIAQRFITALMHRMEIEQQDALFFGSSCGGFFTLSNISHFPKSTFIADIAQTNLYTSPFDEQIAELEQLVRSHTDDMRSLKSVFDFWRTDEFIKASKIIYLQNNRDTKHSRTQLSFFLEGIAHRIREQKGEFNVHSLFYEGDPNKRAHSPLGEEYIIKFIQDILINPHKFGIE